MLKVSVSKSATSYTRKTLGVILRTSNVQILHPLIGITFSLVSDLPLCTNDFQPLLIWLNAPCKSACIVLLFSVIHLGFELGY